MKLHQMGSVREYQTQFEWLASRVQEWPERALVGSYIGGLKDEIQSEVKLFHPTTLVHATYQPCPFTRRYDAATKAWPHMARTSSSTTKAP